jgi:diguanylate cyclase (GGDEF)-like protein
MGEESTAPIRILFVEDMKEDVERAVYQLQRAGITCEWCRVETERQLSEQLHSFAPDIILSDFSLPRFDGMSALRIAGNEAPQIPFIFLSGTIGEERAIEALRAGAVDYVLKENMVRLAPAIRRAIAEAEAHRERIRQEAQIARLNRVLRMLGGINGLVLRIRDRNELLRETCRLAVVEGGYASAIAAAEVPGPATIQPVAWSGVDPDETQALSDRVADSAARERGLISGVISSGREAVCKDVTAPGVPSAAEDPDGPCALLEGTGLRTLVVLPLMVDGTAIGVLVLAAHEGGMAGEEELSMLREVAGNLSFGLQYLQRDTRARFLSHFDPQTGLAKRPLFCERVQRLISLPVSPRTRHAVAVMDIERLSVINDSFGRRIGDLLLQHVAERLRQTFPGGQVAHFGGGTFALVRTQGERTDQQVHASARRQADRIFSEPFVIEGHEIPVRARGGYALWPEDGEDAMTLVQNAEAAAQHARESGEYLVRYSPASRSNRVGRLALEHRLRFALERGEFELHYQPKVSLASRRIQGAEALLRWRHDEELVPPAQFLPSLESTGLIVQVGYWVIEQAARDCQEWMRAGLPPARIAVNISPLQLRDPDFEQRFLDAVASWSTPDWGLDIEIVEGLLQEDSPHEVALLQRLRDAGSRIAIDDFGTGYSSLARLAALPVNTLKIDRSFVTRCTDGAQGSSLVRTIIALARALEMLTVAEGVEKPEELELLQQLGCDKSQGFLHSPAVPPAQFGRMLAEGYGHYVRPAAQAPRPKRRARG